MSFSFKFTSILGDNYYVSILQMKQLQVKDVYVTCPWLQSYANDGAKIKT